MTAVSTAIVIGSGFGGLALAIRLQSAGIATTIIEARDRPGGRAYVWKQDGYTFDAGPTVITDPACLEELWALSGSRMADDVTLLPVDPFYRLIWNDGTRFDYSNNDAQPDTPASSNIRRGSMRKAISSLARCHSSISPRC
jgi:phytoene desaturase